MSNTHTDADGFEYDGDLIELLETGELEGEVMDEEEQLVSVVFTKAELEQLGTFLKLMTTFYPHTEAPQIVQQVMDFSREVMVGGE